MNFTWRETKRQSNLKKHGLDFADAQKVFDGPAATTEDSLADSDDPPEFTLEDMKKARLRVGLQDVTLEEWQASVRKRLNEPVNLNITLEPDVASWIKQRAEASEFNGLINSILREAIHSKDFAEVLRKLTHEELQQV
jgi:hypothetical protein